MRFVQANYLLILQLFIAPMAFASFSLWPPVSGRMLLVALDGSSRSDVARTALAGGAALLRAGVLPGSMVVSGNRADIAAQRRGRPILILAASSVTCGSGVRGE
ncbi:hypothetical protein [Sphingomonas lacusdianchii]|uniref:hypothetical protein n=1 Tax=Sphingomonas lacusdianchii TaxID=2917992 RepID=UPI001F5A6C7E|nr:hypothetical protein [Sphingomonas sp. JXJ CY 53]